jgi:site-specific DNA recombinase
MPSNTDMRKCVGYARVSTAEQAQRGYSVRQQAERLRTWAEEEGYEMVEVVEESGVSGTVVLLERPGFSRLFDLVIGGEASVVVAQDADRISREPWHFGYLKAKLEEYGATLRTLDDAEADDSPESEFFRDIRRGMAKMERSVTARRTRRGREQRAREGKVVGAGSPPLGFCFNAERTNFVVDEETMPLVRRVFRLVAEEGEGLSTVKKSLEREGIPTPRGGPLWHCPVLRDVILSDLYKPHDREELEELAERGQLSAAVLASLEPEASYGVWWYGRDATKRTGKLTATGGPARRFGRRPEEDLIAVPVPDAGVPKEWVGAAREAIRSNVRSASAGRRLWELSGGVGYCACGRRLSTNTNAGRAGRRPQYDYVCSRRRRHGSGACPHSKFHKAEEIEERVRAFVYRLLHDPEALRRQVLTSLELDRVSLGRVEEEAGVLLEQIAEADRERDGYLRLAAKGRISDGELDGYLAELEQRKDGATRELGGLRERRERLQKLDELAREVDAHLADLPHLIVRTPVIREHETAPPKRGEDGSLPIYLLNPERIRERTTEEIAELREQRDRERAERYRWAYGLLGLRVVASKDGTLELTWRAGSEIL